MNDNLVTIEVNGKVIFAGKADLQFSLNQKVREPLRITKGKGKLMEALTESFIKGGINSMENRPIEELQETIKEYYDCNLSGSKEKPSFKLNFFKF